MFFAPALRPNAVTAPDRSTSDFGLERFMRDALSGFMHAPYAIDEEEHAWTLRMDVPGVPREQLRVQLRNNAIEIETDKACARQLRAVFDLPAGVDTERIDAHLQDGVLTLKVAKAESAVARRVEVH